MNQMTRIAMKKATRLQLREDNKVKKRRIWIKKKIMMRFDLCLYLLTIKIFERLILIVDKQLFDLLNNKCISQIFKKLVLCVFF